MEKISSKASLLEVWNLKKYPGDRIWIVGGHPDNKDYQCNAELISPTELGYHLKETGAYACHSELSPETPILKFNPYYIRIDHCPQSKKITRKNYEIYVIEEDKKSATSIEGK